MAHGNPNPEMPRPLDCEEWLTLLPEALEGALAGEEMAAFEAHRAICPACSETYAEARRGGEWLDFLRTAPEPPADLADRILARTPAGELAGIQPALAGAGTAAPAWYGRPWAAIERHGAESRLLMTAAMAFFSIAFTLNLIGVRLRDVRVSDLAPSALAASVSRSYYSASAHVMHYYENLRFVYEVESRVNELRRAADATAPQRGTGSKGTPSAQNSQSAPRNPGGGATLTPAHGKDHAAEPKPQKPAAFDGELWGEPIPAAFVVRPGKSPVKMDRIAAGREHQGRTSGERATKIKRAERSLA
jgi:hypothetical protein